MGKLFRENGIDFERVNYFAEAFTEDKLHGLLKKAGMRPYEVLRRSEPAFKELRLTADTPDEDVIKFIIGNPGLLQRPMVEVGDKAVLARPIEKALLLLGERLG